MKKWITLLLCAIMIMSLVGCGQQAAPTAAPTQTEAEPAAVTAQPLAAEPATEGANDGLPSNQSTEWQQAKGFDPKATAILVIDIVGAESDNPPEPFAKAFELVAAARELELPIVFIADAHLPEIDNELALWGEHGLAGDDTSLPLDGLNFQEGDYFVTKRRYNAFFQTDLDLTLRELGVDTLIVCGVDTNICVLQTLAGAYFNNYKIIVAEDATFSPLGVGTQEGAIDYFAKCYDARIVTTETVIKDIDSYK